MDHTSVLEVNRIKFEAIVLKQDVLLPSEKACHYIVSWLM